MSAEFDLNQEGLREDLELIPALFKMKRDIDNTERALARWDARDKRLQVAEKTARELLRLFAKDDRWIENLLRDGFPLGEGGKRPGKSQRRDKAASFTGLRYSLRRLAGLAILARRRRKKSPLRGYGTDSAGDWLFGVALPKLHKKWFGKAGISRPHTRHSSGSETSGPAGGLYIDFALAVCAALGITKPNGKPYKADTIAAAFHREGKSRRGKAKAPTTLTWYKRRAS